jgi:two-component system nitrogen regulation sensor histidine kinase NtrY
VILSKRNSIISGSFAIALLLITTFLFTQNSAQQVSASLQENFEQQLTTQQKLLQQEVNNLTTQTEEDLLSTKYASLTSLYQKEGISLFIFNDSTLKFWSNNEEPIDNLLQTKDGFFTSSGGCYEKFSIAKNKKIYAGTLCIKRQHRFENSLVKTAFHKRFDLPKTVVVSVNDVSSDIKSLTKNFLHLDFSNTENFRNSFLAILEFLAILLLLFAIYQGVKNTTYTATIKCFLLLIILFVFRYFLLEFHFPFFLYEEKIMGPELFAYSEWLPSLGDLMLHSIFIICVILFVANQNVKLQLAPKGFTFILIFALLCFTILLSETIELIVFNSNVELDVKKIFALDFYSIVSLLVILILLLSFLLLCTKTANILEENKIDKKIIFTNTILVLILGLIFYTVVDEKEDLYSMLLALPVVAILFYRTYKKHPLFELNSTVFLILFISLYLSAALENNLEGKENNYRKQKISLMSINRDPIAEYLFQSVAPKINADSIALYNDDSVLVVKYLRSTFSDKYWDKYDINVANDSASIKMEMIAPNLFHSENTSKNSSYVGAISLDDDNLLYISLTLRNMPDEPGFPILLVNQETENNTLNSEYSTAKYIDGELVNNSGTYHYPLSLSSFGKNDSTEYQWLEINGCSHLLYRSKNNCSIISLESWGVWSLFSVYSYLFLFFCIITLLAFLTTYLFTHSPLQASFKNRLQFSMLILLFFSAAMTGAGSIYYISKQYNKKNEEAITEKIKSVKMDVERRLKRRDGFSNIELIKETLDRYSKIFFSDINLFDANGQIIVSSRNDIFTEGLLSQNMHPQAFYMMHYQHKTYYTQTEEIESMQYLSTYTPFFNSQGKVMGYLNLPYFSRQNELSTEISNFLVALVNIYGLLVVFSLLAALVVSNYITKPLSIIQEKLKNISLSKRNEMIQWSGTDEIGSLVSEYNRKVLELSESAEKLAKSEREGAWREMAKQVAHEIKNPLTPMKLNVQYLKRLYKDIPQDEFEERLNKISNSLIEQIDTLSNIATEFSNFARMPDPQLEHIDMLGIIENCQQLYSDKEEVKITFENQANNTFIKADKDQMLRVFNNLVKNAIQAIPDDRSGKIEMIIKNLNDKIIIEIHDNGKGISEDDKEKIFIPNFTTKNSGMGLGLAMVKKMIEGIDGKIWFESHENIGTTFYVEMPTLKMKS